MRKLNIRSCGGLDRYKTKWKKNSLNKGFWKEILVGRKIKKLAWNKKGLSALILDNGERVYALDRFFIKQKVK